MQSSRFHPAGKILPARLSLINFRKPGKPRIALTDYRAKITQAGYSSEKSAFGKTCCAAAYRYRLPELDSTRFRSLLADLYYFQILLPDLLMFPDFQFLELAKGFEPPTP
jgi:hypothetical protein